MEKSIYSFRRELNLLEKIPVWMDCEFTGLHRNAELISIGALAGNGSTFYGEFIDYTTDSEGLLMNQQFLDEHVFPNLLLGDRNEGYCNFRTDIISASHHCECKGSKAMVAQCFMKWLDDVHDCYTNNANVQFQFYMDCYAYDWMLFNDWLADCGFATEMPSQIYYIPVDLCTELQIHGYDPDCNREEFIDSEVLEQICQIIGGKKHNSLFDAIVQYCCHRRLEVETSPMH